MKLRILSLTLALLMFLNLLSLSACQNQTPATDENAATVPGEDEDKAPVNPAPETLDVNGDGEFKMLSLGNSFSVNAYKYLHPILRAEGFENVTLGNLYKGGCDLKSAAAICEGTATYPTYYKYNTEGVCIQASNYDARVAIAEEDWDVITIQQVSGQSGQPEMYQPYLDTIIQCVRENRTVKNGLLAWHMTWAYQTGAIHEKFPVYNNDQMTMYNAILSTTEEHILPNAHIDLVIPAGTAIQNARTTAVLGDKLTTDGYHLNDLACYLAGYTWYTALTGKKIVRMKYTPTILNITSEQSSAVKKAANATIEAPFQITEIDE